MKRIIPISFLLSCLSLIFSVQSTHAQVKIDTVGLNKLKGSLKTMSVNDGLKHATWGFCLLDPTNGKVVAEYESGKSLMPASSMKVITTVAALNILGPNYTFDTYLEYTGTITKDSVLNGDLYVRGTGDPTLGSQRIDSLVPYDSLLRVWAVEIKKKGIKQINGRLIADASAFEDYATIGSWNWDDIGQYYGAGAAGLNINENKYTVYYSSTSSKAKIDSVKPLLEEMTIWNDVRVGGSGDEAYIYGAPDNYYRYVTGTIPANRKAYEVDGSLPDPPLFLAAEFKRILGESGIVVSEQATTVYALKRAGLDVASDRQKIYTHHSAPLSVIVDHTNHKSVNLYAEALLKAIGRKQSGIGSRSAGAQAVEAFYSGAGIDMSGMHVEDGSGLSRLNYFTPETMCRILAYEFKQSNFGAFSASLPISGKSGTLKTFADNTSAEGKIFAKSGSMYKVRSYSGYVRSKNGDYLAFCVMVNNYSCGSAEIKSILEKLAVYMVGL